MTSIGVERLGRCSRPPRSLGNRGGAAKAACVTTIVSKWLQGLVATDPMATANASSMTSSQRHTQATSLSEHGWLPTALLQAACSRMSVATTA